MALLGFQKQFANDVTRGHKAQAIRKRRKHAVHLGEFLHFYVGLKTSDAREILPPRACSYVADIKIEPDYAVHVNGDLVSPVRLSDIAKADGFEDSVAMLAWFKKTYGLPFDGQIIQWLP